MPDPILYQDPIADKRFAQRQSLFGSDASPLTQSVNTYSRIKEKAPAGVVPTDVPEVLYLPTQGSTASDVTTTDTTTAAPKKPTEVFDTVVAPFAIARALTLMDQYKDGFWTTSDAIEQIAADETADPSAAELARRWTAFQAFSYLDRKIMPSQADFNSISTPSQRPAFIRAKLTTLGINTASALPPTTEKISLTQMYADSTGTSTTAVGMDSAALQPYAETVGRFCKVAAAADTPAMTAADAFNNAASKGGVTTR